MNILVLNSILYTANSKNVHPVKTIKDTLLYNQCLGFVNRGHHVTLIAAEEFKPTEDTLFDFEILFFKSYYKSVFNPHLIPYHKKLYSFLQKNKNNYDLIISSECFSLNSLIASVICPEKLIIWQELAAHNRKIKKIPSKLWYNTIVRSLMKNVTIVPRSLHAQKFISKFSSGVTHEIIGHGANIDKFKINRDKTKQFITIGQLIPRKNIESIIRNFDRFLTAYADDEFKLYIAGKGELESKLKGLVKTLHREKNIFFTGHLSHEELNSLMGASIACLVNTLQDNNMVCITESILCATPVLTNSIPYNSHRIIEKNLGIVKDNWDETDLIKIIDNLKKYIENCVEYRNSISTEAIAGSFTGIYQKYILPKTEK